MKKEKLYSVNTELGHDHFGFPSIKMFNQVIGNVSHKVRYIGQDDNDKPLYDTLKPLPKLICRATTKIHGTNGSFVIDLKNDVTYFQSRENVISPLKDNAKFATDMIANQTELVDKTIDLVVSESVSTSLGVCEDGFLYDKIVVFGEWCGGNIQKGENLGIAKLGKRFVIFAIRLVDTSSNLRETYKYKWLSQEVVSKLKIEEKNIFNIYDFPTYDIIIDFNNPKLFVNDILELTMKVESECPVTKQFGETGIGEGVVFKIVGIHFDENEKDIYDNIDFSESGFWFKSKGEKHAGKSKVKTHKTVDNERIKFLMDIADKVTPEWRLEQALEKEVNFMNGGKIDRKHISGFIRNVIDDIVKEELDFLLQHSLNLKDIGSYVSKISRDYFFNVENKLVGL